MNNGKELSAAGVGDLSMETILRVVSGGDTSTLTPQQKLIYYYQRCEAAGLDPKAQPFEYTKLGNKEVLYAKKAASEQLAAKHGVVMEVVDQRTEGNIRTVTVRARTRDGRQTDEIGCVTVQGLSGDQLCNAYMKAVTKAKRRAVLSICGLGMIDETELETVHPAVAQAPPTVPMPTRKSAPPPPPPTAKAPEQEPIVIVERPIDTPPPEVVDAEHEPVETGAVDTFYILKIEKKDGKKRNGEPWTRWGIHIPNGPEPLIIGTFDAGMGATAEEALSKKHPVEIAYEEREFTTNKGEVKKSYELLTIKLADKADLPY